jgi:hypothetical protein
MSTAFLAIVRHSSSWVRHHSIFSRKSDKSGATGTWSIHGRSNGKYHMVSATIWLSTCADERKGGVVW